jgi:hypothetical protein
MSGLTAQPFCGGLPFAVVDLAGVAFAEGLDGTSSLPGAELRRVALPDAALEVEVRGSGEPVVLIQTAVTGR